MSEFRIGHLEVDSPYGNAGGVIKGVHELGVMAQTGVGWMEPGSFTLEKRIGNSPDGEVVYLHDPVTGETYNSLGMPNKGMDVVETEIPEMAVIAHAAGKQLVVNVAPVSDNPVAESVELVTRAYEAGADAVLLNAGCPNVVTADGGRHEILSHNAGALLLVLEGLKAVTEKFHPVFIRTSPLDSISKVHAIAEAIKASRAVSAVFPPNTWPGHRPLDEAGNPILEIPGGMGGKSGPATSPEAAEQTAWMKYCLFATNIDVVSSGGITTGKELAHRMNVNRASAGAGTTFFYESGDWKHDVDKLLWEFSESL
ncbi:MAG: hypothetical protein ACR2FM_03955 [Candidatus Saccharimonadales bacterium]